MLHQEGNLKQFKAINNRNLHKSHMFIRNSCIDMTKKQADLQMKKKGSK